MVSITATPVLPRVSQLPDAVVIMARVPSAFNVCEDNVSLVTVKVVPTWVPVEVSITATALVLVRVAGS